MNLDLSLYLVTDSDLMRSAGHDRIDGVCRAVEGGVTAVQVRDKYAEAGDLLEFTDALCRRLPEGVPVLVNDRVDVFVAARDRGIPVAGVHVGQGDLPVDAVRAMIGPRAVLGLSAATEQELTHAQAHPAGVDYVGIGAVHATSSKDDAPSALGLAEVVRRARACRIPAVAIGGIVPDSLPALRAGGLAGVAVISWVCAAPDPRRAARELARAWGADA